MLLVVSISVAILSFLAPTVGIADANEEMVVSEIRVRDRAGKGVRSTIYEVRRDRTRLFVGETDRDGVFSEEFRCPQRHQVVAKPVAGPFTESDHKSCAPKLVLEVCHIGLYPQTRVRIIVPFAAGGNTDVVARTLAQGLQDAWKQEVVIENTPGGGGTLGTAMVAGAAPNGYTLLMGVSQNFTIDPNLHGKLPYDPRVDFSPVSMVVTIPTMLVASPSSTTESVKDIIDTAKTKPGRLIFASTGVGSASHLSVVLFEALTRTTIEHVKYPSSATAVRGLESAQADFAFDALPSVLTSIKAGKIKALAVAGPKRADALPEVPTMAEAGITGYDSSMWIGLFAPAGTPEPVVRTIQSAVASRLKERKLAGPLVNYYGMDPVGSTSDQFAEAIRKDATKWAAVLKAAGLKLQK